LSANNSTAFILFEVDKLKTSYGCEDLNLPNDAVTFHYFQRMAGIDRQLPD
jgi:hypothetical protein